jgi:protein O-GlcNAc transferase
MKKYPKLDPFMFYYYLGLAYYDKRNSNTSLKWYKVAETMNSSNFKLMNSIGITYDEMRDYENGEKYYLKCIGLNPKYYSAYYNLAILYKNQDRVDDAIIWYKKAI